MLVFTNSWKIWLAGMAASLAIFGVIYFTVIKPDNNAANQALTTGLQQVQKAESSAAQQISSAASQATSSGQSASQAVQQATSAASSAAAGAGATLTKAQKLANCLAAAGTDTTKIAACQAKYMP